MHEALSSIPSTTKQNKTKFILKIWGFSWKDDVKTTSFTWQLYHMPHMPEALSSILSTTKKKKKQKKIYFKDLGIFMEG
jgi:hypothetical protein